MTPLYILPFDHRSGFAKELLGFTYPVKTKGQAARITSLKTIIFEAVRKAQQEMEHPETAGILVEEEFGASILEKACRSHLTRAVTVEKSGQALFDFQYGDDFAKHLEKYKPDYAKVLIRYDQADEKTNKVQNARLKTISRFCKTHNIKFMLEPLLVGKGTRFNQMKKMIVSLQEAGIHPDVWKLEGLDKASEWKAVKKLTDGDLIILGRGASKKVVDAWICAAAESGVVRGFAIGRTLFFPALKAYLAKDLTKQEAVDHIAKAYLKAVHLFETHRPRV